MKKLIFAVSILMITSAFEQSIAFKQKHQLKAPVTISATKVIDSLAFKMEKLNEINRYVK